MSTENNPLDSLLSVEGLEALDAVLRGTQPLSEEALNELIAYNTQISCMLHEIATHRLTCLHANYPPENTEVETLWRYFADDGKVVEAIKVLRPKFGYSISVAKRIVDAYREGRYAFKAPTIHPAEEA